MKRAGERLTELVTSANILVLASHQNGILREFCNRAVVLERGVLVFEGGVDDALAYYNELIALSRESGRDARPDSPLGDILQEL
ncbi:MAG: hypothetical protein WDM79_07325 [Terricaulis sp.]